MWIRSNLRPKMKLSSSFLLTFLVSEHKEEISRECFRLSTCQTVRCLAMRTKVDRGIRIEATSLKFQFVQGCSLYKFLHRKKVQLVCFASIKLLFAITGFKVASIHKYYWHQPCIQTTMNYAFQLTLQFNFKLTDTNWLCCSSSTDFGPSEHHKLINLASPLRLAALIVLDRDKNLFGQWNESWNWIACELFASRFAHLCSFRKFSLGPVGSGVLRKFITRAINMCRHSEFIFSSTPEITRNRE